MTRFSRVLGLVLLVAIMLAYSCRSVKADTPYYPSAVETTIDWFCYKPTKITFNYAYTNEHSIANISTIGASLYKYTGGPTFLEFIGQDVDTYTFDIIVRYPNVTAQVILIGLWSGTMPMSGITIRGISDIYIIHVTLRVTEQPSYPSESEVAQEVVHQIEQSLVQQQQEIQKLMEETRALNLTVSVLQVITVSCVLVSLALSLFSLRRYRTRQE